MRAARAAPILLHEGDVALIERRRDSRHCWIFPGGGGEPGETPELAAVREGPLRQAIELELLPVPAKELLAGVAAGRDWPADVEVVATSGGVP